MTDTLLDVQRAINAEACSSCMHNPALEEHSCPYKSDIDNDSETLCNCCDACQECCADEI